MDILFKPRVEATKQMTQNWTFRGARIRGAEKKLHLRDMYVVFVSFSILLCAWKNLC